MSPSACVVELTVERRGIHPGKPRAMRSEGWRSARSVGPFASGLAVAQARPIGAAARQGRRQPMTTTCCTGEALSACARGPPGSWLHQNRTPTASRRRGHRVLIQRLESELRYHSRSAPPKRTNSIQKAGDRNHDEADRRECCPPAGPCRRRVRRGGRAHRGPVRSSRSRSRAPARTLRSAPQIQRRRA